MILVCPTSFKGTITATDAAGAMADGVREACEALECVVMPVSDGGPGLIDALRAARTGEVRVVRVRDPLGRAVDARILLVELDGEPAAVVECADACGMQLLAEAELDPLRLGSEGVGELIAAAAALADTVVVGLGGSATVDGGAGMAAALGWELLDEDGARLEPGGGALRRLHRVRAPEASAQRPRRAIGLADVRSPLLGRNGAARVFGPQKGASREDVEILEAGLARLAEVVRRDVGIGVATMPGAGAAGGLGAAVVAFLGGTLEPGGPRVLDLVGFDERLRRARLVVTGEGSWDAQSTLGKVTGEIVERCGRASVPVLLVAGRMRGDTPAHVTRASGDGAALDAAALRRIVAREVARMGPAIGC